LEVTRSSHSRRRVRLGALLGLLAVVLLCSGCSLSTRGTLHADVTQQDLSAGNEPYFVQGGITYQIQESRALNPFSDDVEYFAGLKDAQKIPGADFWYGVFLWAKNQSKRTLITASQSSFVLTDSDGNVYHPTRLSPSINPFAWSAQALGQNDTEPNPDSLAASGTSGGGLILFELPQSVYQNRPLTLHLYAHGSTTHASYISLDL
jgi:hypothetical protein